MSQIISSRFLAIGIFLALAGCGGGGDGSNAGTSAGTTGSTSASTPTSAPSKPTLAAAKAVIDGTTLGDANWQTGSTSTGGQGQAVGGLNCALPGNTYTYTHLSIFMDGKQLALPSGIGTVDPTLPAPKGCVYPLHTDDASGKIRMDATTNTYTLGQFFAIWGQPLSTSNVAGLQGTSITAYVNSGGTLTQYTGDLASLVLPEHGEVTLVIGTPVMQIPTYTWSDPPPFDPNIITLNYGDTVGTVYWPDGNTPTGGTGADVDGLTCAPGMAVNYHVHAHLAIINNGQWLALPQQIGILGCNYEMHTHDRTGIIHIEAPSLKTFTLGQFFDIWGQPLTDTNVAGVTGNVVAYINDNGDARRYMGDLRSIGLISHRDITLQIGTPAVSTLATYSWYEPQ